MAQQSWWASQNLPPQVVGTPKHTPGSPLCPTSTQSIVSEGRKLGVRGGTLASREVVGTPKIGPTGGGDPKTYSSISITPYLNLASPCSPSSTEPPWAPKNFLRPQEALGAFGSLWKPLAALGLQSDSEALLPLLPLTSPRSLSLPLTP